MGFKAFSVNDYTITPEGEVINNRWNRKKKLTVNSKGYLIVNIAGKTMRVHRLVAQLYVPNPENKPQVNHKDGNKLNNRADNLEWVSNQENRDHAVQNNLHVHGERCPWSKLTQEDVDYIRTHTEISCTELSKIFSVNSSHISAIRNHCVWK